MFIKLMDLLHYSVEVSVDSFMVVLRFGEAGGKVLEPKHYQAQEVDEGGGRQRGFAIQRHGWVDRL